MTNVVINNNIVKIVKNVFRFTGINHFFSFQYASKAFNFEESIFIPKVSDIVFVFEKELKNFFSYSGANSSTSQSFSMVIFLIFLFPLQDVSFL